MALSVRVLFAIAVLFFCFSASNSQSSDIASPIVANHIFSLLPVFPTFSNTKNELCKNDSQTFREHLREFKVWAVKMLDASTKLPDGILAGNSYQLGHFDECLSIRAALADDRKIKGQYCIAHIEYFPQNFSVETMPSHSLSDLTNISAWHHIKSYTLDRSVKRRDEIFWSLCIPDSCSSEDVQEAMSAALGDQSQSVGIDFSVNVKPTMCQVGKDGYDFSWIGAGHLVVGGILFTFISLVFISTALQSFGKISGSSSAGIGKFLNCFSAQNNFRALVRVDKTRDIMVVHTFKFISMMCILMGHRFIAEGPAPTFNPSYYEDTIRNPAAIFLVISPVLVVDTFFFLSGFLTANQILKDLDTGRFRLMSFYIHRYIRLTPVYMLVVAFYALFVVHASSGPLWLERASIEQKRCAENWWTNLLYINNYVNSRDLCMFQSWHLTCDFHFLLVAPPLVYFLWKKPKYAIAFILALIAFCGATLFTLTFVNNLDPIIMTYKSVVADLGADPTFRITYIPTHTRYIPYLIGILASFAYYKRKTFGIISERLVMVGTVVVGALLLMPILSALMYYRSNVDYNVWLASLFAALRSMPWAAGIAIITVVVATKNGYYFQRFFESKFFAPLSRLSYAVFITHSTIQLLITGSQRTPGYNSHLYFTWYLYGDIFLVYMTSLIFHLVLEAPILRLDRTYLTKSSSGSKKEPEGRINQGFSAEIPEVFSNSDGHFAVTSENHQKYRDRNQHYEKKVSTTEER